MLQSMGLQRAGHDLATEQLHKLPWPGSNRGQGAYGSEIESRAPRCCLRVP